MKRRELAAWSVTAAVWGSLRASWAQTTRQYYPQHESGGTARCGCRDAGARDSNGRGAGRRQVVHRRPARPDAGADRALSRRAPGPDADGGDLSIGGGRGGPLVEGPCQPQGRRRPRRGQGQGMGRQRDLAGRLPPGPGDDGQQARLDAEAGRRDDRPAPMWRLHPAPARAAQAPATSRARRSRP